MAEKPRVNSSGERELEKVQEQFVDFDNQVKELTMNRMNLVPKTDYDQQTKMSQSDIAKSNDIYLKPSNYVASREKFNEKYRKNYEFDKEYVNFIAENIECRGELIEMWTKPYPGCPAEFWKVPVNKPLWAPRYVSDQLKRKFHHHLVMQENTSPANYVGSAVGGQYYGKIVADTTTQRLDARDISTRKSISMVTV